MNYLFSFLLMNDKRSEQNVTFFTSSTKTCLRVSHTEAIKTYDRVPVGHGPKSWRSKQVEIRYDSHFRLKTPQEHKSHHR